MTFRRLIANLLAGIVLIVLLVVLTWIIIDEGVSKAESIAHPKPFVQEIPFR